MNSNNTSQLNLNVTNEFLLYQFVVVHKEMMYTCQLDGENFFFFFFWDLQ